MSEFLRNIEPWIWLYIAIGLFVAWMLITLWRDNRRAKRELDASLAQYFGKPLHEVPADVLNLSFDDSMIRYEQEQARKRQPQTATEIAMRHGQTIGEAIPSLGALSHEEIKALADKIAAESIRASVAGATKKGTK